MDTFLEKIVVKQKTMKDTLIVIAAVAAALVLIYFSFALGLGSFILVIIAAIIYGAYVLISMRNIEYEYTVTNGDLDIDKIIAQRKRKRVFSCSCKEFELVAPKKSSHFTPNIQNFKNHIDCTSSKESQDTWFVTLRYKGEQTVLYFEPNEKMIKNFKIYIPRKIMS